MPTELIIKVCQILVIVIVLKLHLSILHINILILINFKTTFPYNQIINNIVILAVAEIICESDVTVF